MISFDNKFKEKSSAHRHACIIYDQLAFYRQIAARYIFEGLNGNDKCFMAVDEYHREMIEKDFAHAGVELQPLIKNGQLTITTPRNAGKGIFDSDRTVEALQEEARRAVREGYTSLRVLKEADLCPGTAEQYDRMIYCENILNRVLLSGIPLSLLCAYNKNRCNPEIIKSAIKTHPVLFRNNEPYPVNFHYIPPEIHFKRNSHNEIDILLDGIRRNNEDLIALRENKQRQGPIFENFSTGAQSGDEIIHRKQMEDALFRSEERYREIVEGTDNLVTEVNTLGKLIFVNETSKKVFGLSPEKCIGRAAFDFIHPDDREKTEENFKSWIRDKKKSATFENRQVSRTGKVRDMLWTINIRYDISGDVSSIKSIARDITDRKRIEKALKQSRATLASIFKAAPIGIGMVKERDIVFVNDKMVEMTGYSKKEMIGRSASILYPDRNEFEAAGRKKYRLIKTYGSGTVETKWKKKNNEIMNILLSSTPVDPDNLSAGVTFTAMDITKRKHAEMELKRSEAFLNATFSSMQDGISVLDRDLVIQKVNPKMKEWHSDKDSIIGKKCHICYYSSPAPCYPCPSMRAIQSGRTESDVIPGPAGSKMEWLEIFSYPIKDEELNETSGVVEFIRDITDRMRSEKELEKYREHLEEIVEERTAELKRANEALERARAEAENANILKSEFIANISHEIRTPLNAVTGFSELLTPIVEDEKQKNYLTAIKKAGKSLLTLINDILDLSKIEAGKIEIDNSPVNIKTILNEVGQIFALQLSRKNIRLIMDIDTRLPEYLLLDEIRLRQILLNIVGNAVKFTDKGYIKISAGMIGRDFNINIEDTGMGIPENDIESIFDSFKQQACQDSSKFSGTGLGLTICKRLAEMMNGRITAESQVGRGSIFKIRIHNVKILSREIPARSHIPEMGDIRFKGGRVLVVDDVESNRTLLKELLNRVNLEVLTAENGYEAVVICPEFQPDLVLMDLRMPVMDGFEATEHLRKDFKTRDIPIVAATAGTDKEEFLKQDFNGILIKPFETNSLVHELSKYFDKESIKDSDFNEKNLSFPEPILRETASRITELLSILESDFMPRWEGFQKRQPIKELKGFGNELKSLGMKYEIECLADYGNNLILHIENYDIHSMLSVIGQFPETLEALKKVSHER